MPNVNKQKINLNPTLIIIIIITGIFKVA